MNTEIKTVPIGQVKPNPGNPRVIKDDQFAKLVKSLQDFPEMLGIRELVVDENMVVLGGNMRLRALQHIGAKQVQVRIVRGMTDAQKREFVIKDNSGFGEWDWDVLANEWDDLPLDDWGVDTFNSQAVIERPSGDAAGASPWDRVGDASEGVMFSFGAVQKRLPTELFEAFSQSVGVDNLEAWLRESLCN